MKDKLVPGVKWAQIILVSMAIGGCAPGPPPPVPPGLWGSLFDWLLLALLVWIVVLMLKRRPYSKNNTRNEQFTDALNAVNNRISALEEAVEHLKRSVEQQKGGRKK